MNKIKKTLVGVAVTALLAFTITGCTTNKSEAVSSNSLRDKIDIERINDNPYLTMDVLTDKEAGVQYLIVSKDGGGVAIQPLLTDGNLPYSIHLRK